MTRRHPCISDQIDRCWRWMMMVIMMNRIVTVWCGMRIDHSTRTRKRFVSSRRKESSGLLKEIGEKRRRGPLMQMSRHRCSMEEWSSTWRTLFEWYSTALMMVMLGWIRARRGKRRRKRRRRNRLTTRWSNRWRIEHKLSMISRMINMTSLCRRRWWWWLKRANGWSIVSTVVEQVGWMFNAISQSRLGTWLEWSRKWRHMIDVRWRCWHLTSSMIPIRKTLRCSQSLSTANYIRIGLIKMMTRWTILLLWLWL